MSSLADAAPEQQAASHVFDSLTPQQQAELISYAENLLVDSADFNARVRQSALASIQEARAGMVDVDAVTDSIMPLALSRVPDGVRHAIIVRLRQMLLDR